MTKSFLKEQKKILEERLTALENKLKMVAKKKKSGKWEASFPNYGSGEDDSVFEFEDYDKNLSLEQNLKHSLKDVKRALRRIKEKRYGICDSCKKEIPEGRLKVYPAANLCVACKSKPSLLRRIWPFGRG